MKDFRKFHADKEIAKYLISEFDNSKEEEIFLATKKIITECRKNKSGRTLLDKFLSEYGLTNDEGVALMCLAESVLRIPDDSTKDELISEKITNSNWVNHINQADSFLESMNPPYVLKADGLAAGKGVLILNDLAEAKKELRRMIIDKKFGKSSLKVVIEEFLDGIELSCFVLTDGHSYKTLPFAKDYKKIVFLRNV